MCVYVCLPLFAKVCIKLMISEPTFFVCVCFCAISEPIMSQYPFPKSNI
jgi:hypothetical protein